jgi:enamine deaminase RidA (YjgF/YER057c/UK114 family)
MNEIARVKSSPRLSQVVIHGGIAYLTGQTASNRDAPVADQTREVLQKIDVLLAAAGTDKSRVLFAQVWLKHVVQDFDVMNASWEAWTNQAVAPARATVQAELADERLLVEIAVTAALP